MTKQIASFQGEYRFLSNFYPSEVELDGMVYPTIEHAFQAAKTLNLDMRESIRQASTPGKAKRLGRIAPLRADWLGVRLDVKYGLVKQKFSKEPLRTKLLNTGDAELIEGNWWGDTFWGVCMGKGENNLGKILMRVREELRT